MVHKRVADQLGVVNFGPVQFDVYAHVLREEMPSDIIADIKSKAGVQSVVEKLRHPEQFNEEHDVVHIEVTMHYRATHNQLRELREYLWSLAQSNGSDLLKLPL